MSTFNEQSGWRDYNQVQNLGNGSHAIGYRTPCRFIDPCREWRAFNGRRSQRNSDHSAFVFPITDRRLLYTGLIAKSVYPLF